MKRRSLALWGLDLSVSSVFLSLFFAVLVSSGVFADDVGDDEGEQ